MNYMHWVHRIPFERDRRTKAEIDSGVWTFRTTCICFFKITVINYIDYIYLYMMDYAEMLPCSSRDDDDDHDDDLCYWCVDDH